MRGQWQTVARVADNQQRRRVARFSRQTSNRLRFVFEKAAPNMGVCEIRGYDDAPGGSDAGS